MSKDLTEKELSTLIDSSLNTLSTYIKDLKNDTSIKSNYKRAGLIAYWLLDYVRLLKKEKDFDPKILLKYERGDIVSVNFGYRIGSELGGRHFAVVLDVYSNIKSEVVTVLPLVSKKVKHNNSNNRFYYELKKGLYQLHSEKLNLLINECRQEFNIIKNIADSSTEEQFNKLTQHINSKLTEAEILQKSLEKLKDGTIVNVGQITTISKLRILNPKKASDSLNKIRICGEDLDEINNKLTNLYIKNKKPNKTLTAFIDGVNRR